MIYHGELVRLGFGTQSISNLADEKNSTLTISKEYIEGSGSVARGSKHHNVIRSWSLQAQCLFDDADFSNFINNFFLNETLSARLRFRAGIRFKTYTGNIIITQLSFAGQGKGLVRLNITAVGNGALTAS